MTHTEIKNEFLGIDGINEAKKIYKELAKRLHPDVGLSSLNKWGCYIHKIL